MPPALRTIALSVGAAYLVVCSAACVFQRSLLYHPGAPPDGDPGELGLKWREVSLSTEDGETLNAWYIEAEDAVGCSLVSHGNAGNIEHRLGLAATLARMGISSLLYDYRGYGGSTGSPTEKGLYLDGVASYEWLLSEGWSADRVFLWGESLGGGVATELATRFECAALILDHTFTSSVDVGAELYPWLPVRLLSFDTYENEAKLPGIKVPILIIHSPQDELIPYEFALRLKEAAHENALLISTEGGHNGPGFMARESYLLQVEEFLSGSLPANE